ncbi:FGGY-family carbohydrate kinase [candidate division KSB1 bacterium]|nr:FGGY-family carbohydrate kinase [candidate division KSB1 bacterium]
MADKYIIAHDMGTSADKAILVTIYGEIIDSVTEDYPLHHPQPGFAEQDPEDWWKSIGLTTRLVLQKNNVTAEDVVGITFSSQMQCIVPVVEDGTPLTRAMIWLDGRGAGVIEEELWTPPKIMGYNIFKLQKFLRITGGSPGHTGKEQIGKLLWLKKNLPDIYHNAYKFIDAKDFIIFRLTGEFVTSVDLAVIWWLLDTRNNANQWDAELCKLAGITPERLSIPKPSSTIVGYLNQEAARHTGLPVGLPVINGAGDMTSEAVGSGALNDGELHISVGTSGWIGGHVSQRKIDLRHYAGCIGSAHPEKYYLAMAHQETCGICLEWMKNKVLYHEELLKMEQNVAHIYQLLDRLAEDAGPGAEGLIFTPWLFGERCPLDDDRVRGGLFNIGLNHTRNHIIRAIFEGIGFNTRWALQVMEKLYSKVDSLTIVGGGAKSDVWCQIIADITDRTIQRVVEPHFAGAKGIALLASMALGYIDSFESIKNYIKIDQVFNPNPENRQLYDKYFKEFKNLYRQNKKWYARMNSNL